MLLVSTKIQTMRLISFVTTIALFFSCQQQPEDVVPPGSNPSNPSLEIVDVLALGDSYTKGQGVPFNQNFPSQLAGRLALAGFQTTSPTVIAQTGWRTDQLSNAYKNQEPVIGDSVFSLVTLCIGVNNQYQNTNFDQYDDDFEALLRTAIERAGGRRHRVLVLSIPDWAYTPYGQSFTADPSTISNEIDAYNKVNKQISEEYGVTYVTVTDISRNGLASPDLVASDGLHPSAKQYGLWMDRILPVVQNALQQ
jgi:acyl-CoA thioesterase I